MFTNMGITVQMEVNINVLVKGPDYELRYTQELPIEFTGIHVRIGGWIWL